jgi:hypothetical protein
VLTRSSASDTFYGDLLVDHISGWLAAAISDPRGELAELAKQHFHAWDGWRILARPAEQLRAKPARDEFRF